ncbi:SAM-dependent methyltransferase [Streptomyces sp. Ru73]|uniref:class I SAM-dependent methyltransferase n=1 Tax=Streptomyces sp. Ru73 TaxID=2080748 RepID=UPI000CDE0D98|nr:methyltransferase domain-containing protein [Streptomyces sp. Ru73]POX43218.1 SAM-dependent methyltransferase [Streptomyces sp. Ru73]
MTVGFSGEVAEYYARFRRGYRPELLDALQEAFGLTAGDTALDLGCGTGALAVPLAARVGSVLGMDPEPDMLRLARRAADEAGVHNATWVLGADTDVAALGGLLGRGSLAMTVIGQALHGMDHDRLFHDLRPLLRPGGGIAVVTNGVPLWQQESYWSDALRGHLERYFGSTLDALTGPCGTADDDRACYARALHAAGYDGVREIDHSYRVELSFEELVGGVFSAVPAHRLPRPDDRPHFAAGLRDALPEGPYAEEVRVRVLVGRTSG